MSIIVGLIVWSGILGVLCTLRFKSGALAALVGGLLSTLSYHGCVFIQDRSLGAYALMTVPIVSFVAFGAAAAAVALIGFIKNSRAIPTKRD